MHQALTTASHAVIELGSAWSAYFDLLNGCRSVNDVSTIMQREASAGLTAVACGMVTGPKALSPDPFYFNNWPQGWLAMYKERAFFEKDAVPRWALNSGASITWSALKQRLSMSDPAHEVYNAALAFGFREVSCRPCGLVLGHLD